MFEETVAECFLKLTKNINPKNSNEEKFNSKKERHKENHIQSHHSNNVEYEGQKGDPKSDRDKKYDL